MVRPLEIIVEDSVVYLPEGNSGTNNCMNYPEIYNTECATGTYNEVSLTWNDQNIDIPQTSVDGDEWISFDHDS